MSLSTPDELEKLVSFNTVSDAKSETKPTDDCPRYINSKLEEFGFSTQLLESNGFWTSLGMCGEANPKILFVAHFDVVPVGDGWNSDPFKLKVEGDRAYGRGTCDDKGNIVSMLLLAEKISKSDLPCTLMIAATGDEEIGGANGAKYLKEHLVSQGMFPDFIVIADGLHQQIIHKRRNILPAFIKVRSITQQIRGTEETVRFTTETFGTNSRHSAYLRLGVDRHAMLTACKYLDLNPESRVLNIRGAFVKSNVVPDWVELDIIHPDESGEEFQYDEALTDLMRSLFAITRAPFKTMPSDHGTTISPNLLYKEENEWTLYCDIRAMTNDGTSVKQAIETALKDKVDTLSINVNGGHGCVHVDSDSILIQTAKQALDKEGISFRIIEGFGASDSRYFAGHGAQLFDFGPKGDNIHGANEWVSLSSLEENAKFFYTLVKKLCRE
jgi:succinyl-diaminopimelate desuccinylase